MPDEILDRSCEVESRLVTVSGGIAPPRHFRTQRERFQARHVALPRDAEAEGSAIVAVLAAAEPPGGANLREITVIATASQEGTVCLGQSAMDRTCRSYDEAPCAARMPPWCDRDSL